MKIRKYNTRSKSKATTWWESLSDQAQLSLVLKYNYDEHPKTIVTGFITVTKRIIEQMYRSEMKSGTKPLSAAEILRAMGWDNFSGSRWNHYLGSQYGVIDLLYVHDAAGVMKALIERGKEMKIYELKLVLKIKTD